MDNLLSEIERWSFYKLNLFHDKWFISFHQKSDCQFTLFPVFIWKMSKEISIKYYSESESAREPYQATQGSAGYDLFAAETKTFLPNSVGTISLDLRWAIPTRFFWKLFPRSELLRAPFVTIDAGVIDADFRGVIQALFLNHHPEKTFTVRTEDRIAQVVFMEKFNAKFVQVFDKGLLGKTKRGNDGFGSTRVGVIKKSKNCSEFLQNVATCLSKIKRWFRNKFWGSNNGC